MSSKVTKSPAVFMVQQEAIRKYRSQLARTGKLSDASDDEDWLARANGQFLASQHKPSRLKVPRTLTEAISTAGAISEHAEVYVFGRWLLLDGAPGLITKPGVKPDRRKVVKTLSAALYLAGGLGWKKDENGLPAADDPKAVTKTNLVNAMTRIFDETLAVSDFDSRLKTLESTLDGYLKHLATGTYTVSGVPVTRSAGLKKLLNHLSGKSRKNAPAKLSAIATSVSVPSVSPSSAVSPTLASTGSGTGFKTAAILPAIPIELSYAHPNRKEEYRTPAYATLPETKLCYTWRNPEPHKGSAGLRIDRNDVFILKPDLDIAAKFNIRAIIDRMAISVTIKQQTNPKDIHRLLSDASLRGYVQDRTQPPSGDFAHVVRHLKPLASNVRAGTHFAILIQNPVPMQMMAFLDLLHRDCEIESAVVPILMEIALDFTPKPEFSAAEIVELREQMVGIIHRHFWCSPKHLKTEDGAFEARNDERQVYAEQNAGKPKTRFLIADANKIPRISAYAWKKEPSVRAKILAKPKRGINLNATVYHGSREFGFRISLQHKIADERNTAIGAVKLLANKERRARVEIELHTCSRPGALEMTTINDLAHLNLREKLSKKCSFKLPVIQRTDLKLTDYVDIFGLRGVCSTSLSEAVKAYEASGRASSHKTPGLEPWRELNVLTGKALDKLSRQWRKFSWP